MAVMNRVASREELCERLTKRVRLADPSVTSGLNLQRSGSDTADDCRELLDLLLLKTGFDIANVKDENSSLEVRVIDALKKEYSPRAAELLVRMVTGGVSIMDNISDVTSESEGETDSDVAVVPQRVKYKKETEIALSRIFDLGKAAAVDDPTISPFAPHEGPSVVTMTGFGELGRFGNQFLQYAFLRCYAKAHKISEVQVPAWVGASLFGLRDRPVQRSLPAVVEYRETKANSTFTTDLIDYIKTSNGGRPVPEIDPSVLSGFAPGEAPVNVDIWGWFQWHTSRYAPYKLMIQDIFTPVKSLKNRMESIFEEKLRFRGGMKRTVVGLHLRLGDYKNIAASSFGYCAPSSWYLEWLAKIWPTLENPILFVASDEVDKVIQEFQAYKPLTAEMIGLRLPEEFKGIGAGFFADWYGLSLCDVVAISNSTFSFTACMMNMQPNPRFFRAHYALRMVEFDPWNADPIIHRSIGKSGIAKALEMLQVLYATQGSTAVLKNMLYELPYYALRSVIMKAVLWRGAQVRNKKNAVAVF